MRQTWPAGLLAAALAAQAGLAAAQQNASASCDVIEVAPESLGSWRTNPRGDCSGHGICLPAAICDCDEGWTSKADFFGDAADDCGISEAAIRILWGFNTFIALVYYIRGIPRVHLRWTQYVEARDSKLQQGRKISLWNNRGLLACFWFGGVCFPSLLAGGIIMQLDPSQRIGIDTGITVVFALGRLGFYGSVWLFQPALLSSILRGKRATRHLVKVNDTGSFVLCSFAVLLGFVPFVTLGMSDGSDQLALTVFYVTVGGNVFQMLLLGFQAYYVKHRVIEVLDQSYSLTKTERTLAIKKALVAIQNENIAQVAAQSTVYLLFTIYPFLYTKHCYLFPIGWTAYAIIGKKLAFTAVSADYGTKTGTRSGTGSKRSKGDEDRTHSKGSSMQDNTFTYPTSQFGSTFPSVGSSFGTSTPISSPKGDPPAPPEDPAPLDLNSQLSSYTFENAFAKRFESSVQSFAEGRGSSSSSDAADEDDDDEYV